MSSQASSILGLQRGSPRQAALLVSALTSILVGINLSAYPYIPRPSVGFYFLLLLFTFVGCVRWASASQRVPYHRWVLFATFTLSVLASRAFINLAGIATPRSTGTLGPLTVNQIWLGGIHIHHYKAGIGLLILALALSYRGIAWNRIAVAAGAGLGLFLDEFGIFLAGHTYHSYLSYPAVAAAHLLLLVLLWEDGSGVMEKVRRAPGGI